MIAEERELPLSRPRIYRLVPVRHAATMASPVSLNAQAEMLHTKNNA